MILKARAARGEAEKDGGPPLASWSPEVEMGAKVVDQLRRLEQVLIAVNGGKPGPVQPTPRPDTLIGRLSAKFNARRRQRAHETLRARVLPGKYAPPPDDD